MIRLGLIGYGKAGQAVAAVLNDDPRFDLRWIARRSTQREAEGLRSVAAPGFAAPGVVVCYTGDPDVQNGRKFLNAGYQIAAGVPLQVGEGEGFRSFRIGLFGLDKLRDVDATVARLIAGLDAAL